MSREIQGWRTTLNRRLESRLQAVGKTEREFPLPVDNPKSTHGQFRHARLTDAGTYLVAHMDLGKLAEYDETGKQVWSAAAPGVWSAVRLKNGNTLCCGKVVREINSQGETVWEFTSADVPGYKFDSMQIAARLPSGNTLINNWVNQWNGNIDPGTAPVQALETPPANKLSGPCVPGPVPTSDRPRPSNCSTNQPCRKMCILEASGNRICSAPCSSCKILPCRAGTNSLNSSRLVPKTSRAKKRARRKSLSTASFKPSGGLRVSTQVYM